MFPGAPLTFNRALGNIHGNLDRHAGGDGGGGDDDDDDDGRMIDVTITYLLRSLFAG